MAVIFTTLGELDESLLVKREGVTRQGSWVEYYLNDKLVHRSVEMNLWGVYSGGNGVLDSAQEFFLYGHWWKFDHLPVRRAA